MNRSQRMLPVAIAVLLANHPVQALELYADEDRHVNADITAVWGTFNSRKNYDGTSGGSTWREGFIKYGLSADQRLSATSALYGSLNWVSSGTWGDGDAAGNTNGSERTTKIEDAFLGWRSGDLFSALGKDGIDFSAGRQTLRVGSGFLINDDGPNLGKGPAEGALNRGGAYYLAARHAFDRTARLRIGGDDGVHGSLLWLQSDNRAQANTELAAGTLDYTHALGTLGLTWIHGIGVDDRWASASQSARKDMDVYSLRGEDNAGIDNAHFAFEYAHQNTRGGAEQAWYLQAGYSFEQLPWTPQITYRYSRYSAGWDSLFSGLASGYGTWLQGEVAGNYAGPFNSNAGVHHLGLKATPRSNLTVGALYFEFDTLRTRDRPNLAARELDLYVEWAINDHLIVTPLVGLYQPRKDEHDGGNQVGGSGTNLYSQLVVAMPF